MEKRHQTNGSCETKDKLVKSITYWNCRWPNHLYSHCLVYGKLFSFYVVSDCSSSKKERSSRGVTVRYDYYEYPTKT